MGKIKITVYLPPDLVGKIKQEAEEQCRSLTSQIEYSLVRYNKIFDIAYSSYANETLINERGDVHVEE